MINEIKSIGNLRNGAGDSRELVPNEERPRVLYNLSAQSTYHVKVDRWFPSSRTCSHCGHIHKELALSDRTYTCPVCGHVMDRDHQAAVNIDREGLRMIREAKKKGIRPSKAKTA